MGWTNQAVDLIVISDVPGFSGLFVYAPALGTGKLIASITAASGLDPFGNSYQAGVVVYSALGGGFAQLLGDALTLGIGGLVKWQLTPSQLPNALLITDALNANSIWIGDAPAAADVAVLVANQPGAAATVESWHTMTLAAGFTAGTPPPRYRLEPVGSGGVVRLSGAINLTANQAAATTFFTLPAGYRPAVDHFFGYGYNIMFGFAAGNNLVGVTTGGLLQIGVSGNSGDFFVLDNMVFELD